MSGPLFLLALAVLGLVALVLVVLRMRASARRPQLRLEREYEFMARAEAVRRGRAADDPSGATIEASAGEPVEESVRPLPLREVGRVAGPPRG